MDFGLNEQQEMLQKSARDFLADSYSDKILAQMAKDPRGFTAQMWNSMAELGWMALSIPEAYGGIGDFLDLTLVLKEMGRAGLISPYFSSVVLGASLLAAAGTEAQKQEYLPAVAEGRQIVSLAWSEHLTDYSPGSIKVAAVRKGDKYIVSGRKLMVPDAGSSNHLICAFRTSPASASGEGISLFIVDVRSPGITCNLLDTVAPDKLYEVKFDEVEISSENLLGQRDQGWPVLIKTLDKAAVASCALMLGGAERVLDLTLTYAKDRTAFGHPIGAYQSIQHRCADMLIDLEGSKSVTYQAAWKINQGLTASREIAIAKAWVGQAYRRIVTSAHQIHGAIGFTEDHVLHWYTRRARALEVTYGDINYHLKSLSLILAKNA